MGGSLSRLQRRQTPTAPAHNIRHLVSPPEPCQPVNLNNCTSSSTVQEPAEHPRRELSELSELSTVEAWEGLASELKLEGLKAYKP
jgi:hypothetical protein